MKELVLYITESCELCDAALEMLLNMEELTGYRLDTIDVAISEQLINEFGEYIPVLKSGATFLKWPFNASDVMYLIDSK